MAAKLESGWQAELEDEFSKPYMQNLKTFLLSEKESNQQIYPPNSQIFNAFNETPFNKVKVVILGQDPYHGEKQAHGLSFSVNKGIKIPPSLRNIYKELETDIPGFITPDHGDLSHWAAEGVLLLNATLTVRAHQPGSHQGKGWEAFTDQAINKLSKDRDGLVFILWGKYAQQKELLIDSQKHLILKAPHPSPFSSYTGFFGSSPFSKTNAYLISKNKKPVNWQIV
ncbi:uracil-DNA glycosylase [Pedobacter antarcticus 4BY]|uniref:Uracil-DNA glycosylase n=2 Tax=Pedobacter antarcticus TaxID=34086 RepID=A0A081PBF0_9SPHI|nr:uracil-DNA glycosylase [Pedobacter antarcticus]KEQ28023.1 uracil-DNA glycosylase [Pedobacter antarcticus 4BY]